MGEVLGLDKENKELKEHKVKTSIALTVLDRLQQEHYGTARLGTQFYRKSFVLFYNRIL